MLNICWPPNAQPECKRSHPRAAMNRSLSDDVGYEGNVRHQPVSLDLATLDICPFSERTDLNKIVSVPKQIRAMVGLLEGLPLQSCTVEQCVAKTQTVRALRQGTPDSRRAPAPLSFMPIRLARRLHRTTVRQRAQVTDLRGTNNDHCSFIRLTCNPCPYVSPL